MVEDILYFVYDGWQVVEEHEAVRTDDILQKKCLIQGMGRAVFMVRTYFLSVLLILLVAGCKAKLNEENEKWFIAGMPEWSDEDLSYIYRIDTFTNRRYDVKLKLSVLSKRLLTNTAECHLTILPCRR